MFSINTGIKRKESWYRKPSQGCLWDNRTDRGPVLHVADPGSMPGTPYDPLKYNRSDPWAQGQK